MLFDQSVPLFLTTKEAANLLGIKAHTLATWRSEGSSDLAWQKMGRSVRYRRADIEAWLDRNLMTGSEFGAV